MNRKQSKAAPRGRERKSRPVVDHDIVRQLQQLRHEKGTLVASVEIAEREREEAWQKVKKMQADCVSTVKEYKQRLDNLLALVRRYAPDLADRWMLEEQRCQPQKQ